MLFWDRRYDFWIETAGWPILLDLGYCTRQELGYRLRQGLLYQDRDLVMALRQEVVYCTETGTRLLFWKMDHCIVKGVTRLLYWERELNYRIQIKNNISNLPLAVTLSENLLDTASINEPMPLVEAKA